MSAFALSNLASQTRAAHHVQSSAKMTSLRRRWMHTALRRQAIMMPAISPFMSEGTIARWKVKEGESFAPGDVLLQIELNDIAVVDIEACNPGIMGKILTPDGTPNVPVEAVIAIVARDATELASIQSQSLAPTPPAFTPGPSPPSATLSLGSPSRPDLKLSVPPRTPGVGTMSPRTATGTMSPRTAAGPMSPRTPVSSMTPRTPSLFELHTMGYGHRSAHVGSGTGGGGRGPLIPRSHARSRPAALDLPQFPQSPALPPRSAAINQEAGNSTPIPASAAEIPYPRAQTAAASEDNQLDGAAIRRMILANLSATTVQSAAPEVEDFV